nr:oxidation resistance protein 1 [Ipomoea batatas]
MGREVEEEEKYSPPPLLEHKNRSLRSKAAHFVSDLTTVILNPISDKPSKRKPRPPPVPEDGSDSEGSKLELDEGEPGDIVDGPDTSSFTAFLYSLLSNSEPGSHSSLNGNNGKQDDKAEPSEPPVKEPSRRRSLITRGKQTIGRAVYQVARLGGFRNQGSSKGNSDMGVADGSNSKVDRHEGILKQDKNEEVPSGNRPETSEPSLLLSEKTRTALYTALPALVKDRKWVMLYSTWRNGISLSTLYRRSMLWPGLSLLVVGDRKGTVFGGLVEAPLRATTKRRYQGTNASFVFTNVSGHPTIFRPTGINRYYTMCSTEYIALGGGGHFALYLDGDLLTGSSAASQTYGNSCLSCSEDFEVKEVELWGFVYASKYEEILSVLRTEAPGICRF